MGSQPPGRFELDEPLERRKTSSANMPDGTPHPSIERALMLVTILVLLLVAFVR